MIGRDMLNTVSFYVENALSDLYGSVLFEPQTNFIYWKILSTDEAETTLVQRNAERSAR